VQRQVEPSRPDKLALGADTFEEHDQVQLEEDDRIDARPRSAERSSTRPSALPLFDLHPRAILSPQLDGDLFAGHRRPDNHHQQFR